LDSFRFLLLYLALKALAYTGWCAVGLGVLRPSVRRRTLAAVGLGVLRLAIGLLFATGIFLASTLLVASLNEATGRVLSPSATVVLAYLAVYVPVRWIEWALIEALLTDDARTPGGFFLSSARARPWRLGGILVSCLADVPVMLVLGGLPMGRFMC
jgi:hypothetical protein